VIAFTQTDIRQGGEANRLTNKKLVHETPRVLVGELELHNDGDEFLSAI
jgi:hypothetical protein